MVRDLPGTGSGMGQSQDDLRPSLFYLPPSSPEFEDDKISLPFVVTDLRGRNLRPMRERTDMQVGSPDAGPG